MKNETLIFIYAFIFGLIWYRFLFYIIPYYFKKPLIRSVSKLQWHHLHNGILLVLIGIVWILVYGINLFNNILLGVGLGFIIDLFISSLKLKTNRLEELGIYRDSLIPTLFLGFFIIVIIFLLSFFF